jgi:hypothetical protein
MPVTSTESLTEEELERELVAIARSRNRSGLQPRVAAVRALLKRRREEREAEPDAPLYSWQNPALETPEQRRQWLELDLIWVMSQELELSIGPDEWNRRSARVRRLEREADAILRADDPDRAFADWATAAIPR